jgi:Protein of unknown function (DUF3108)
MKRILITSLLTITLLAPLGASQSGAQQAGKDQAGKEQTASATAPAPTPTIATLQRDFKDSFPIPAGEKLEYDVKLSRFPLPRPVSLGVLTLENLGAVTKPQNSGAAAGDQQKAPAPLIEGMNTEFTPAPDEQLLRFRATAVSKGMLIALVGYDVRNRFETLVDLRDFSARVSFKEEKEGKRHIVQSTIFDRAEQQVRYLTTDLAKPDAPPRAKPLPREDGMLGLLSAIYFVRLQKLKEGQMLSFPVSADEENFQFEVLVGKRESIKTDCGKVKTVRLEPKIFGPGRYFKRPGEMTMWVSDDNKRTPLRLVTKTSKGTVTANLLNFKKKCNIIEQEEEGKQKND